MFLKQEWLDTHYGELYKMGVAGEAVQSDCGIVYVPNRNYILCIMLDEEQRRGGEVIAQISKKVYDYVTKK